MISSIAMPDKQSLVQILRFVCVGVLNTAIDFGVLNGLIFTFGVGNHGQYYVIFKTISFLIAVSASYIFNKYWVFAGHSPTSKAREGFLFFMVSGIGFLLNVSISTGVFMFASNVFPVRHYIAANVGAVAGSLMVLSWNFLGYKLIVFKKSK